MKAAWSNVVRALALSGFAFSFGCGGSTDSGPTVSTVSITSPAAPPSMAAIGRTVQFAAVAKDAGGATISGVTITWGSSNQSVATVDGNGLVTAAGNGTTNITATAGGVNSTPVVVTVTQVAKSLQLTPATIAFGAFGSTRQVTATLLDSTAHAMTTPTPTFTNAASGKTSVSSTGLVTAVGNTTVADSIIVQVTSGGTIFSSPVVVTVQQVAASVTVSSTGIDSLKNTGSTKQYTAAAKDSNNNAVAGATFNWTSTNTSVATVNAGTGLATAVADGTTNITAASGGVSGFRALQVRRFAKTFSISPNTPQSITTNAGTIVFTGTATDTSGAALSITWTSDNTGVLTMSPASGTSGSTSTATAKSNGSANVTLGGGLQSASVGVTVTGQSPSAPSTIAVSVGDDFFSSDRNASNPAVDTLAIGGTVTWTWHGSVGHNVTSGGSPSFSPNSSTISTGTFSITFNSAGTYGYYCTIHGTPGGGMHGTVVVK